MRSYKEYMTENLGYSNIGRGLIVKCCNDAKWLQFESEGPYKAYIVDEEAEIADHYHRQMSLSANDNFWIKISIYDDGGLMYETPLCKEIDIYRAGKSVCIIQLRRKKHLGGSPINEDEED